MTSGMKALVAGTLVAVVTIGGEVAYLYHRNHPADVPLKKAEYKGDPDNEVFLKSEHPSSFQDAKSMKGRTLWVSAGGQMDYYPYTGHAVDYRHSQGVLLGAEKILVQDAVEQVAPKQAAFRIPQGDKQVLFVFTKPDDPASTGKEFAVPVGFRQAGDYTFSTDQIFLYDDPHKLFAYWGPAVWKAIDEHRAIVGMNERQVQTALGQVSDPHGDTIGERTVIYDNQGKPKRVVFSGGKAIKVEEVTQ